MWSDRRPISKIKRERGKGGQERTTGEGREQLRRPH